MPNVNAIAPNTCLSTQAAIAASVGTAVADALAATLNDGYHAKSVVVALSGGIDSMVLLDAAHRHRLNAQCSPVAAPTWVLQAIHVHHGLSQHADGWADFCQTACKTRDIELTVVRVSIDPDNTGGQGVEGAARRARYAAFARHGAEIILAGQHADDQAETVLHQMLRGTGLAGLAAMGDTRRLVGGACLARPLLKHSRADIEAYAAVHQLTWVEDDSNTDTAFSRNFIRHELLPLIATRYPHYAASLGRTAKHAAESAAMLADLARLDLQWDGVNANASGLDNMALMRQTNALYHWLRWQGMAAPSHTQLEEWARQLFRPSPSDKPHQAGGHDFTIRRKANQLLLVVS